MLPDLDAYRQALIDLYLRLPDMPRRLRRHGLRLVRQLWDWQVPLGVVETAFLLVLARRAARPADAMPLGSVRSVYCFLPVIEELFAHPVPESYFAYLCSKVALRPTTGHVPATTG
ncbi:MAG TPA: hypothetical protein VGX94_01865 [Terriglobia bacterium]|nr:hypothetical protein [Terriglobia bacterium]